MVILQVSISIVIWDSISITLFISALHSTLILGNFNPRYVIVHRSFNPYPTNVEYRVSS
jgi:hypothetical protein